MSARPLVAVVGAGLAGLSAACEAIDQGAQVVVFDRDRDPVGATGQSAGWLWRYVDVAAARLFAPTGDPHVQAAIVESLDADLAWLEQLGAVLEVRETGRSHTRGARIDPRRTQRLLLDRLERRDPDCVHAGEQVVGAQRLDSGGVRLRVRVDHGASYGDVPVRDIDVDAVVFAGGGYVRDLVRIARDAGVDDASRNEWVLRAARGGDGSSIDVAAQLGAVQVPAGGECLVRLVPTGDGAETVSDQQLVRAGELQVDGHVLVDSAGDEVARERHDWSGAIAAWQLARRGGIGRLELPADALRTRLHAGGTVLDAVRAAIADGADGGRISGGGAWLAVRAGITTTRATLRVDSRARVLVPSRFGRMNALDWAFAAGADAACSGLGGSGSGLAQALVLGRRAGRAAAAVDTNFAIG